MRLEKVIHKPIVTEKTVSQTAYDRYVFRVDKKASKGAISKAVSDLFSVDVLNVKTMIMPGKKRRIRGTSRFTKTSSWKKATVQIKEGQKIDLFDKLIGGKSSD